MTNNNSKNSHEGTTKTMSSNHMSVSREELIERAEELVDALTTKPSIKVVNVGVNKKTRALKTTIQIFSGVFR